MAQVIITLPEDQENDIEANYALKWAIESLTGEEVNFVFLSLKQGESPTISVWGDKEYPQEVKEKISRAVFNYLVCIKCCDENIKCTIFYGAKSKDFVLF